MDGDGSRSLLPSQLDRHRRQAGRQRSSWMQKPRTSTVSVYAWGSRNRNEQQQLVTSGSRQAWAASRLSWWLTCISCVSRRREGVLRVEKADRASQDKQEADPGAARTGEGGGHHAGWSCCRPAAADITSNCISLSCSSGSMQATDAIAVEAECICLQQGFTCCIRTLRM